MVNNNTYANMIYGVMRGEYY